jgi:hypothetical protein
VISGMAMTTYGLPPYYSNFAAASPNVRETYIIIKSKRIITDSLPGNTLGGPASIEVEIYCLKLTILLF